MDSRNGNDETEAIRRSTRYVTRPRVHNFAISLDGFGTDEGQTEEGTVRPRRPPAAVNGCSQHNIAA